MSDPYETFGRYLLAALIAHRLGITIGYAYNHYVKDMPALQPCWAQMAAEMDEAMGQVVGRAFGPIPMDGHQTVQ